tara:strand:- start:142 stop:684 length:543 start_codon:yes stop_codon:yes gene_type:complete
MTDSDKTIYVEALKKDNAELTKQNYDLMKKYSVKTSDPITNDVIDRIFKRHIQGMETFKQTMDDNPKTIDEWTEDIIEELIDAICYLVVRKKRLKETNCIEQIEEVKNEADILMMNKIIFYEKELLKVKNNNKSYYKEIETLKKEMALVREQAQIDILSKDQELGRVYKKINDLSNAKKV